MNFNARYVYDEQGRLIGEYAPDGKLISETVWFNDLPIATLRPKGANNGTPLGIPGTTTGNPSNGATAANANNAGNNSTTNRVNVEVFYIHADHLGTPRTVTRSTVATGGSAPSSATPSSPGAINKAVWLWNSDPFGTTAQTGAGGSTTSAPNKNPQNVTGMGSQVAAATFEQNLRMPGQLEDQETKKFYNYFRDYDSSVGRYTTSDPIGLNGGINTLGYAEQVPLTRTDPSGLFALPIPAPPPPVKGPTPGLGDGAIGRSGSSTSGCRDECKSCLSTYPDYKNCNSIDYPHRSEAGAWAEVQAANYPEPIKKGKRERANGGPCARYAGEHEHVNLRYVIGGDGGG